MTVTKIHEDHTGFAFRFDDAPVTQLRFDFAVTLISLDDFNVRIEVPFRYRHKDAELTIDPEVLSTAGTLLDLHHAQLQRVDVHRSGQLQVSFSSDRDLTVGPHPHYESFSLHIAPGYMFIGEVGGGIGTYRPPERNTP